MRRWIAGLLVITFTLMSLTATAFRGWTQLKEDRQLAAKSSPEQAMAVRMMESAADDDPEIAAELAVLRRRLIPTFADYLAIRTKPLGEWRQPWPIVFWGGEILLACVAGVVVVLRAGSRTQLKDQNIKENATSV